jgi:hypothetical protein
MGSYCHRSHLSKHRRKRDAGPNNSEPEPITRHKPEPITGNKPFAFTGNKPFAFTGNKPEPLSRHKPFTKPSAKL